MKIYTLLGLFIFLMTSCGQQTTSRTGEQVNLAGYEIEKGNNGLERAAMKDVNGVVVEEGFVRNGGKEGTWVKYHPNGKGIKSVAAYIDGQLNGIFIEFDQQNRMISRIGYKDGVYHGPGAKYRTNRPVEEFTYKNGKLEGKYLQYDDRYGNLIKEIDYKDGKVHGRMVQYNREGDVVSEYKYENGEIVK
ncbi:MAG: hypothetical protein AAGG68_16695 [Bacteroidota bacterium]